jgi:ACS family tartrate transporter-like MFS transporter
LFAVFGLVIWLPLLVQGMGFSNRATGFVLAPLWAAAVPGMVLWGRSSDHRGERVWHVAIAALTGAAALILAAMAQSEVVRLIAFAIAAIGVQAVLSPFYSLPALFLSGPAMTAGFALISSMGSLLGGFCGQYLIGVIREQTGGFTAVLATLAGALVATALIVLALDRAMSPQTTKAVAQA